MEGFFDILETIESILRTTLPVKEKHDRIHPLLADVDVAEEFWKRLDDARWLTVLLNSDYLSDPPNPEQVPGGGVRAPVWPVSRYLARMARLAPARVAKVFASIETDNPSIIADRIDAALAMPLEDAKVLVPSVCRAAERELLWIGYKRAIDLCIRFAKGRDWETALTLAEALFEPDVKRQHQPRRGEDYWYDEGLKELVPLLAELRPTAFLPTVCKWLDVAVQVSNAKHSNPETDDDTSVIWRPAIEDHEQNRDYEFAAVMVGFVRDGCHTAIQKGGMTIADVLSLLEQHRYPIFTRLRIHLIAEHGESMAELSKQAMMNREWFDDDRVKHEYARLMGMHWPLLSDEEQRVWLGWVDAGPDMEGFDERMKAWRGQDVTPDVRQSYIEDWKFKRLHWIRRHLTGHHKEFYERVLARRGEPELADLHVRMSSNFGSGRESPITVEELQAKSFPDAVAAVVTWRPREGASFMDPGYEEVARTFAEYLATDPIGFSAHAAVMEGRPAVYVNRFLTAMQEAIKAGKDVDVKAVLALCRWVVGRRPEEVATPPGAEEDEDRMVDRNWQWTRDRISGLVETVCKAQRADRPKYPRAGVGGMLWEILDALCRDKADSYLQRGEDADPRVQDYLDVAINSPRGRALSAAMEYARWIANQIKVIERKNETIPGGFDAMPEVREMLEWQIANPTVVALAEIGSNLGLTYWIDREWLAAHVNEIMPLDDPPTPVGWAAWNAFLTWVRAHVEFYKLLKPQFAKSVEHAARIEVPSESARNQPMEHLGQHLMLLHGRGQLGLDADDGLVRRFITTAHPELRRRSIAFVGQSLRHDDDLPEEVITRFKVLWEVYWSGPGPDDAKGAPAAWLFGPWVCSGKFPAEWTLDRLLEFVEVTGKAEPDHSVVEQLEKIAETDMVKSVRILTALVEGDTEGWGVQSWIKSAKTILTIAMSSGGQAQELARRLIDRLGRRGYIEMGDLLKR